MTDDVSVYPRHSLARLLQDVKGVTCCAFVNASDRSGGSLSVFLFLFRLFAHFCPYFSYLFQFFNLREAVICYMQF